MTRSKPPDSFAVLADKVTARLRNGGVKLTLGGEPSYVPIDPRPGMERDRHRPDEAALLPCLCGGLDPRRDAGRSRHPFPGKIVSRRNKSALGDPSPGQSRRLAAPAAGKEAGQSEEGPRPSLEALRRHILQALRLRGKWMKAIDGLQPAAQVWVLPLDHDGTKWMTQKWPAAVARNLFLVNVEGSAGLRLPLGSLPPDAMRRALVLEAKEDRLYLFFPPLLQQPFLSLLATLTAALREPGFQEWSFEGYIPEDEAGLWRKLGIRRPGRHRDQSAPVRERAPICLVDGAARIMRGRGRPSLLQAILSRGNPRHRRRQSSAFRRTHPREKRLLHASALGHVDPALLAASSLARVSFHGQYVGASSQAPRPDESARELYDLEMAYQFLEKLEAGRIIATSSARPCATCTSTAPAIRTGARSVSTSFGMPRGKAAAAG